MQSPTYGQPLFREMRYCVRCCMPESNEGMQFDEMDICQACQSAEHKIRIDWVEREKELRAILDRYRSPERDYDCIIPISGGKDSTFQLHVLTKVYGLRALAVTFSHTWFSETGKYNLQNCLDKFDVDHIMFSPSRTLVNKLARKSLFKIGDACWHCHSGVGAFPLQVAVKYQIPLLIWGESIAETSGRATHRNPVRKFDRDYFTKVSAKVYPEAMVGGDITAREMAAFRLPWVEEIEDGFRLVSYSDFGPPESAPRLLHGTARPRNSSILQINNSGTEKRSHVADVVNPAPFPEGSTRSIVQPSPSGAVSSPATTSSPVAISSSPASISRTALTTCS